MVLVVMGEVIQQDERSILMTLVVHQLQQKDFASIKMENYQQVLNLHLMLVLVVFVYKKDQIATKHLQLKALILLMVLLLMMKLTLIFL